MLLVVVVVDATDLVASERIDDRVLPVELDAAFQPLCPHANDGHDPIEVVKWKDVYGLLEATIDKAEDVANIIERITIKHA